MTFSGPKSVHFLNVILDQQTLIHGHDYHLSLGQVRAFSKEL